MVGTTTRTRPSIGRPFEECGGCGAYVARVPFDEWQLMSRRTRAGLVLSSAGFAAALGLAPGALAAAVAVAVRREEALGLLLTVGAPGLLLALAGWGLWLGRLSSGSQRRMSDPWYQAKLARFAIESRKQGLAAPAAAVDALPDDARGALPG